MSSSSIRSTANSEKFHFTDFTLGHYGDMLQLAKRTHTSCFFDNVIDNDLTIIWRHDADFSMHAALDMARVEAEHGIGTTYFVLLHSEFYNFLDRENIRCAREIMELGHRIELHFDPAFYSIGNFEELEKYMLIEKKLLEDVLSTEIRVFSTHNPMDATIVAEDASVAGMINASGPVFQNDVAYCSDSNGVWHYDRLEDFVIANEETSMTILTHPEWWSREVMSPQERIDRCIEGRASYTREFIRDFLNRHGRDPVDW